jgi:thiamine biosynthesis lipoprotein
MSEGAVATSGNYRNYREVNGKRVGHTISTVTGKPMTTTTLSATIYADNCALADALATACMAMPIDDAYKMINKLDGVEALFVIADGDNNDSYKIIETSGFPK